MSADPTVSVVIPVWNVAPYLRECLDSVINQTIGLDRLEVLAIDDGSTDGSGPLLDHYAEQYPQVRVFHEANSGGPGRPRNVGMDNAAGTYVFFLDADDYLGVEALERLVGMAEKKLGIVVDELLGQQDVVIKSLGSALSFVRGIAGAADLGNQKTILVLDVGGLMNEALRGESAFHV